MNEKLPEMYRGNIKSDTDNNERVFSTLNRDSSDREIGVDKEKKLFNEFDIKRKINDIFNSSDYIYKADVTMLRIRVHLRKGLLVRVGGIFLLLIMKRLGLVILGIFIDRDAKCVACFFFRHIID